MGRYIPEAVRESWLKREKSLLINMECLGNPEVKGGMCTQYKNMRMSIQMITEAHKCL